MGVTSFLSKSICLPKISQAQYLESGCLGGNEGVFGPSLATPVYLHNSILWLGPPISVTLRKLIQILQLIIDVFLT